MNIKEVIGRGERAEGALVAAKFPLLLPPKCIGGYEFATAFANFSVALKSCISLFLKPKKSFEAKNHLFKLPTSMQKMKSWCFPKSEQVDTPNLAKTQFHETFEYSKYNKIQFATHFVLWVMPDFWPRNA